MTSMAQDRRAALGAAAAGTLVLVVAIDRLRRKCRTQGKEPVRVAVVGGGIAGCGAAWALQRSGAKVVLYEKRDVVGGNAKTHAWSIDDGSKITTGLSVLAWPSAHFRNYEALLDRFGIIRTRVKLPMFVSDPASGAVFVQGGSAPPGQKDLRAELSDDFDRWHRVVSTVRSVNRTLHGVNKGDGGPSVYGMSLLNPFNLVPLRTVCRWYGVSDKFWDLIIVPIYMTTFLTVKLDSIPAVIAPTLDDIIPLDQEPELASWQTNSSEVFACLVKDLDRCAPGHAAQSLERTGRGSKQWTVVDSVGGREDFDHVVLACPSFEAAKLLKGAGCTWWAAAARFLLNSVSYCHEDDSTFVSAALHRELELVCPEELREKVLRGYANYVEVHEDTENPGLKAYENTFLVSSWYPSVKAATKHKPRPMLVSYGDGAVRRVPQEKVVGTIDNIGAHPHLSKGNLIIAQLLRFLQGCGGLYFCSCYTTPGNGHDLSLLSGFAVACALGAAYPFAENKAAAEDFKSLRKLMGL